MRAIAILLALVYHAGLPGFTGGYVGIEVFFVISGFVITGLLLRERERTSGTSLRSFYGRRARRIIPAASLVIVVTVFASYHYLGSLTGHQTAVDGQWAALFLANVHFEAIHTNYLVAQAPPSPLLNYWSLGVEEQFYIVYPTLFLLIGWLTRRGSFRTRLTIVLVAVIVASYTYSIVLTSTDAQSAYFSLFTRSWELALGGLIAVHGRHLQRIPEAWAAVTSWVGLTVILVASVTLTGSSVYPGALVAIPTIGAGLVIAGGAPQPKWGVERLLRLRTFQFLAAISFPLYLWHWPILEIAAQSRGVASLPVWQNVLLLVGSGVLATLTYYFFENPIRHARFLSRRRWASIVMGLCFVAATLVVTTYQQHRPTVNLGNLESAQTGSVCVSPSESTVAHLRSEESARNPQPKTPSDPEHQTVLFVGDSTACTLLPGLQAVGPSYGMKFENGAVIGCGIVSGTIAPVYYYGISEGITTEHCQGEANRAETVGIERYRPSVIVWGSTDEHNSIVISTPHGSQILQSGSREWESVMFARMNERVERFLATGAKVVLLTEPPSPHPIAVSAPNIAALAKLPAVREGGPPDANDEQYQRMNALLKKVAERHPRQVAVVDLESRVCPSGPGCPYVVTSFDAAPTSPSQILRPDGYHYVDSGALWVAQWLVPRIASAAEGLR